MIVRFLGAQWLAACFVGLVSFGVSVLIARTLGPELFGAYVIAIAAGAVVAILIDGGFGKLLQRERAMASPELTGFMPLLPGLAYGHALLMLAGLCLAAMVFLPKQALTVVAALLFFGAAVLNQFGLALMRGDGRLVRDAGWQVGNRSLSAVCVLLVLWWGASQPWQMLMAQFVGAAAFGFFVARYLRVLPSFKFSAHVYKAVLPFAWIDLACVLYFRADMVLFQFLGVAKLEVGKYGVAYRLLEAVILLALPLGLILFRRFRLACNSGLAKARIAPTKRHSESDGKSGIFSKPAKENFRSTWLPLKQVLPILKLTPCFSCICPLYLYCVSIPSIKSFFSSSSIDLQPGKFSEMAT